MATQQDNFRVRYGLDVANKINAATGTTAYASINLPHGNAPTSPVNGDVWTTTAGMFIQVNGTTVGPLGSGGGGGATVSDTAPGSPTSGMLWFESDTALTYIYYDSTWVEVGSSSTGVWAVGDVAPASPINGTGWFKSDTAQTFMYYDGAWIEVGLGAPVGALDAEVVHLAGTETITGAKTFTSSITLSGNVASGKTLAVSNTLTNGWSQSYVQGTGYLFMFATNATTGLIQGGYSMPNSSTALISTRPLDVGTEGVHDLRLVTSGSAKMTIDSGGVSTFAGPIVAAAATTSIPSIRLPHGAAPSSPTNGDVWTTTTGMYARINGATVGPFAGGGMSNPLTTNGDIIYGVSTTPTRLGIGTAGQALVTNAGASAPEWATLTLENMPGAFVKKSVRAATTANIATLAGGTPNTLDGVTLAANDRILVKDQTTAGQNGIYIVQTLGTGSNGTWVRALDADTIGEVASAMVAVDEGTLAGGFTYDNDLKSTDTLGTTALTWNRVVDAGGATFTGDITLATGTTTLAPLKFVSGPVLTTATAGVIEFNGDAFYGTPDSGAVGGRGVVETTHFFGLTAARTLTNGTGAQSIFGVGLTVAAATTYEIEMEVAISSSGTTTAIKSLSFGGTATLTSIGYQVMYTHSATSVATTAASNNLWVATAAATALGATSTTNYSRYMVKGLVRVNASGTFIPQITWSAAPGAAPSVVINSYVKMTPLTTNTTTTVGAWA